MAIMKPHRDICKSEKSGLRSASPRGNSSSWWPSIPKDDMKVYAVLLLSCLFFSLCSLFTDLVENIHVFEILWWRFFFTVIITGLINLFTGRSFNIFNIPQRKTVALAAFLGTVTAFCTVFALRNLPIGEATLLLTTAPLFTVVLSCLILGEKMQTSDYIALVMSTFGVVFVAQPTFIFSPDYEASLDKTAIYYIAVVVALCRGFFKAAKYVAVNCAGEAPETVIVMYLSLSGFCVSTLCLIAIMLFPLENQIQYGLQWKQPDLANVIYLFLIGLTYCLQQLCVCWAMQIGKPARTSLLKYFDVVLPFVFQIVIFHIYPNLWTMSGCVLIVISMLIVIVIKRKRYIKLIDDELEDLEPHKY